MAFFIFNKVTKYYSKVLYLVNNAVLYKCKVNEKKKEVLIMIVKYTAKNDQVTDAVKKYGELSKEEKAMLIFPYDSNKEDYANYQVRYNKKGELIGVSPRHFSNKKNAELDEPTIDIVDSMQLLFGDKMSKAYRDAKKRVTSVTHVSNDDIDAARRIFHK